MFKFSLRYAPYESWYGIFYNKTPFFIRASLSPEQADREEAGRVQDFFEEVLRVIADSPSKEIVPVETINSKSCLTAIFFRTADLEVVKAVKRAVPYPVQKIQDLNHLKIVYSRESMKPEHR